MKKLTLKGIDFDSFDIASFSPEIPDNFCIWPTLTIAPDDISGGHLFQVAICTPKWLAHRVSQEKICALRHVILLEEFNFELIKQKILEIIQESTRSSWDESVKVLCRHFAWEFEDYQL